MDLNEVKEELDELPLQLHKDTFTTTDKCLTDEEKQRLQEQDKRLVSEFKAQQLELQTQRNWDLFYKRNQTRFFKDRHWTTREFDELAEATQEGESLASNNEKGQHRHLLEVGCGVGNLIFPLVEEQGGGASKYFYYACDISPRAIQFVRAHDLYVEERMKAFQCDITTAQIHSHIPADSLDIVTMIFVLSAIHPDKFASVVQNLWRLLKPGGIVLFRDYGLYDMAQLRFKPGHKIAENLYMRQDGTRSYYFAQMELSQLFTEIGFQVVSNAYVHRRTLNVKEGIDVPRIFLQGKFKKPFMQ